MSEIKTLTIQDIIDAAEKNGYVRGAGWFEYENNDYENGTIVKACILGQAAINLGVNNLDISNALSNLYADDERYYGGESAYSRIYSFNDSSTRRRYSTVFAHLKKVLEPHKDKTFKAVTVEYKAKKKKS